LNAQIGVFTKIPSKNPLGYLPRLHGGVEIDAHYYFLTTQMLTANTKDSMAYTIHKTDLVGNKIDSLVIKYFQTDWIGSMELKAENGLLCLYPFWGTYDSSNFSKNFQLGRYRYDPNFTFVDSFRFQPVIHPAFYGAGTFDIKLANGYIIYNVGGKDTSHPGGYPYDESNSIFVSDTNGNYIIGKRLYDIGLNVTARDLGVLNDQIINVAVTQDSLSFAYSAFFSVDITSLTITRQDSFPQNLNNFANCYDIFPDNRLLLGTSRYGNGMNQPDSFNVSLWDANLNQIKQRAVPRTSTALTYPNISQDLDYRRFDGTNPNSIYIGSNWGPSFHALLFNNHFSLANLDSNLNVRWSKLFGGDFPYFIYWHIATNDGGCLLMGYRRLGNQPTDSVEAVVFKISQQGFMTSVFSLKDLPSENLIAVYPNPTNNRFTIRNDYHKGYEFMLFSPLGQVVMHIPNVSEDKSLIDLSSQPSGSYYYRLKFKDGKTTGGKIMKHD